MYDETSVVLKYYRSDKFKEKYLNENLKKDFLRKLILTLEYFYINQL